MKNNKKLTILLVIFTAVLLFPLCQTQDVESKSGNSSGKGKGNISGTAKLQGQSDHSGITVTVEGEADLTVQTTSSGAYIISDVPVGTYNLSFEKDGYETKTLNDIEVKNDFTVTVDPVELSG
jgi:hypothetical protein